MKATITNTKAMPTKAATAKVLLKAIDMELKAILEDDVRKLHAAGDRRILEAAFLQLIAA